MLTFEDGVKHAMACIIDLVRENPNGVTDSQIYQAIGVIKDRDGNNITSFLFKEAIALLVHVYKVLHVFPSYSSKGLYQMIVFAKGLLLNDPLNDETYVNDDTGTPLGDMSQDQVKKDDVSSIVSNCSVLPFKPIR